MQMSAKFQLRKLELNFAKIQTLHITVYAECKDQLTLFAHPIKTLLLLYLFGLCKLVNLLACTHNFPPPPRSSCNHQSELL